MPALTAAPLRLTLLALAALPLAACNSGGGGNPANNPPTNNTGEISAVTPAGALGEIGALIEFAATTASAPLAWAWQFEGGVTPAQSTAERPTVQLTEAGNFTGTVYVASETNPSNAFTFSYSVAQTSAAPAVQSIFPSGTVGAAGTPIQFRPSVSGHVTAYTWDFGGAATPNSSTSATPIVTLGTPGTYTVACTATNSAGDSTPFTFTITVDPPVTSTPLASQLFDDNSGFIAGANLNVSVPDGAFNGTVGLTLMRQSHLPAALPQGMTRIGEPLAIDVTEGEERIDTPATLTFSDLDLSANAIPLVLHFDETGGVWEPTTILAIDRAAGTIDIEARAFSTFVPVEVALSDIPASFEIADYAPIFDGWGITNTGSYYTPGGNSLGMSAYAAWYQPNYSTAPLAGSYVGSINRLIALRAHLAQARFWTAHQEVRQADALGADLAHAMRAGLALFGRPLVLTMFGENTARAGVAYGYDASGLSFYDPNFPGVAQQVGWSADAFGGYAEFDRFGYLAQPSLGRWLDFERIHLDSATGFSAPAIHITAPLPGSTLQTRHVTLTGSVNNATWNTLVVFVNGVRFNEQIGAGNFAVEIPLSPGKNPITVFAGKDLHTQNAFLAGAAMNHLEVINTLPPSKFLVTLTWEQNGTDVDTYVTEPNGETSWYSHRVTASSGELDIDDVNGYGPEHYTIGPSTQSGEYIVRVHYYSDHGTGLAATGTVSILLNEGHSNQSFGSREYRIEESDPATDGPGGQGPQWVDIARVDVARGVITWQL